MDENGVIVVQCQPGQRDAAGEGRGQPTEPVGVACIKGQHDAVERYPRWVRGDACVFWQQEECVPRRLSGDGA
jgi:hypothetical protein